MKKVYYILLAALLLFLASGAAVATFWPHLLPFTASDGNESDGNGVSIQPDTSTVSPQFRCPLDGLPTSEAKSLRRPIAVMIENHVAARPQSSLTKACIVYETVAEGGITRFMAIYLHNDVETIGPVRSAREYFVDLAIQYDALFAHCGGPSYVYDMIKNLGVADLDEFTNTDAYWRVGSRKAPHNLYTSTDKLWKRADALDYPVDVFFQRPNFKDDDPINARPANATIEINFSKPDFKVRYDYDRKNNKYDRNMGGKPHIDGVSKEQISPKNVVVQFAPISAIANDPKGRVQVSLVGNGKAIVFQDGRAINATWQRLSVDDLTKYYDANGAEIKYNRGQTWIELVDEATMPVSYK